MTEDYSTKPQARLQDMARKSRVKMITIPLEDPGAWPKMMDFVKGWATQMAHYADREISDEDKRYLGEGACKQLNENIAGIARDRGIEMPKRGRPPRFIEERRADEARMNKIVSLPQPQNIYKRRS